MTTKILKLIYKKLRNTEWEKLPFGLRGGKIGCMLFVALYSECMKNARARNLSTRMLQDIISDKTVQHYTLISGKLGAAWALYVLNRKGILEKDEALNAILTSFRMKYAIYYSTAPYQILEDDNLFSSGIYTLAQHPDNDTLERYQVEERLISLVDECERQLSQEFITHFLQSNWTPSMLHSYIFFLQTCIKKKIFTYKANFLLAQVEDLYKKQKEIPLCDELICSFFLQAETMHLPRNKSVEELFTLMGECGFYTLLYEKPQLFHTVLAQACEQHPLFLEAIYKIIAQKDCSLTTLCGWGYGLLLSNKPEFFYGSKN